MNRDKVTELLKRYKSYKFAVRNYETAGWAAIGNNVDRDGFSGGGFGSRAPKRYGASFQDARDYDMYKTIVDAIEGALDTLSLDEQDIIRLKWFEDMTLNTIAMRKSFSIDTVKRKHKKAINSLSICFTFIQVPEIVSIPA